MSKDDVERLVATAIDSGAHDALVRRIETYVASGRHLERASDSLLDRLFIDSFREWSTNPANTLALANNNDLEAEYVLRKREPPYDRLGPELAQMSQRAAENVAADPRYHEETVRKLLDQWMNRPKPN